VPVWDRRATIRIPGIREIGENRNSFTSDLGFAECPIDVQEFWIEKHCVGIDLLPSHLDEFKSDPEAVAEDEEDRRSLQKELDDWESSGSFILWWGKDYWFGGDGEVEST